MKSSFYCVRGSSDGHLTLSAALEDAQKRAEAQPGHTYYVMLAVKAVTKSNVMVEDCRPFDEVCNEPLPF